MSETPHTNGQNQVMVHTLERLDAKTRRAIKSARTRRINERLKPLDELDADAVDMLKRITPPQGEKVSPATASVIFKGMTLRKEIQLAKFKGTELEGRLEGLEVSEQWTQVRHALGLD